MSKYVLAYHGGGMPEDPAEQQRIMAAWEAWFGSMGAAVLDGGNPVGDSRTVESDGSVTAVNISPTSLATRRGTT